MDTLFDTFCKSCFRKSHSVDTAFHIESDSWTRHLLQILIADTLTNTGLISHGI